MNDARRSFERPGHLHAPETLAAGSARATGLQAAQVSLRAQLEAWELRFTPREYAALVEDLYRIASRERERSARWRSRRTA